MASSNEGSKPQTFNPSTVPTPPPTYHQVAITPLRSTSKLITIAGQIGQDATDYSVPSTFLGQVKGAYVNVLNCLKAAGAVPRDIVHVRHYIVQHTGDPELDGKEVLDRGWGALWMDFMDREGEGHRPPDTVLGVPGLATRRLLYEVEVQAIVNE